MLKISYAACLGLSVVNSAQFALNMCVAVSGHNPPGQNPPRTKLPLLDTPSVALAPLALIYRTTYAVPQSPRQRSSGVWVLFLN